MGEGLKGRGRRVAGESVYGNGAQMWVVRVGGDDGEFRPWNYIHEGRRRRLGTPTMALHV